MARVFILERMNETKRHISLEGARDFGDLVYLFDGKSNRPSIWSEDYKHEVIKRFKEQKFDPEHDYFCVAGYVVPMMITVSELVVEYGAFRALLYSAVEQHYLPRKLGCNYETEITESSKENSELPSGGLSGTTGS